MADRTLTINHADGGSETYTINRDKFAGVREMSRGHVYPPNIANPNNNSSHYTLTHLSDTSFRVTSDLVNDGGYHWKPVDIVPTHLVRTGKHLVEFDLTLHSGSIANDMYKLVARDGPNGSQGTEAQPQEGHNALEITVYDDGLSQASGDWDPKIFFSADPDSQFDLTITNLKVTHEPDTVIADRSAPDMTQGHHFVDRAGESRPLLSKVAGGATAAYSLRDLNDRAGNNKVVRVRRDSDNAERDFKAKEVSNGTLKNWVNAQTTLPLDLKTLEADGRTGAIIDAKAAYSLRNLSSSYTGAVVEVRRSSDDTERSFTASEVSDGTLTDWVTASLDIVTPTLNNGGFETAGTNGFDYWIESTLGSSTITRDTSEFYSGTASCRFDVDSSASFTGIRTSGGVFNVGTTLTYSIRAKGTSGSRLLIGTASNDSRNDTLDLTTEWQEYTGTVNPADTDSNIQIKRKDSANATIWIDEVTFTINGKDGHVRTWYDQSGNSNNATQITPGNQPKIVDGGNLLKDSNNKPEIDFDGTDDFLTSNHILSQDDLLAVHAVAKFNNNTDRQRLVGNTFYVSTSNNGGFNIENKVFNSTALAATLSDASVSTYAIGSPSDIDTSNEQLFTLELASGTLKLYTDGTELDSVSAQMNSEDGGGTLSIGASPSGASPLDGTIQEIIIYNSDQTDNRTALEANIGEHYSISGIPAYDNTVNGFVETWYDQSGNGNDATQTSADAQPKIVNAGNLVAGGIDFDGTDSYLVGPDISLGVGSRSAFIVTRPDVVNTSGIVNLTGVQSTGSSYAITPEIGVRCVGLTWLSSTPASTLDDNLVTSVYTSGNLHAGNSMYLNGASVLRTGGTDGALTSSAGNLIVGSTYANQFRYDGTMSEFIVYDSDQSSNRPAIEANIANQYGINLP